METAINVNTERKGKNANEVLEVVERMIQDGEDFKECNKPYWWAVQRKKWKIRDVYKELSIFDWWNDYLSVSQLKQMRSFLITSIKLGYTGYVCFKVGAVGCANGMWANKLESTNGHSPKDGGCLYHTFVCNDNYWSVKFDDGTWIGDREHYRFTLKEIKEAIKERKLRNEEN
jgi:hypothetical protein